MKRKVYRTDRERKSDQLRGAIAFPLVNIALWLITSQLLRWAGRTYRGSPDYAPMEARILLLPWIVHGGILALAFSFRPDIGVGYIASIFHIIGAGIVLGVLFVASCVLSLPAWFLLPLGPVLFLAMFLGGFVYLARRAHAAFQNWWSPPRS